MNPVAAFWGPVAARAGVRREADGWLTVVFCGEVFARYRPGDNEEALHYARGFNDALEAAKPKEAVRVRI